MLNSSEFKTKLIGLIKNKTSHYEAQDSLRRAILEYLISNLELRGTYTGMIPGVIPLPDPLNGSMVTFKLMAIPALITPTLMSASNSGGISAWITSLNAMLKTGIFNPVGFIGGSPFINSTLVPLTSLGINVSMNIQGNNFESVMESLASQLINSITSSSVMIPSIPVTSLNGGVGTVTPEGFYK